MHCNVMRFNIGLCENLALWKHPQYPTGVFCNEHKKTLEPFFPEDWTLLDNMSFHKDFLDVIQPTARDNIMDEREYYKSLEGEFCYTVVIPHLIEQGHKILKINKSLAPLHTKKYTTLSPRADISSLLQNVVYITEVKTGEGLFNIQTVIGQLVIHQFVHQSLGHTGVICQAAFPALSPCRRMFSPELLKFLREMEIEVLFL